MESSHRTVSQRISARLALMLLWLTLLALGLGAAPSPAAFHEATEAAAKTEYRYDSGEDDLVAFEPTEGTRPHSAPESSHTHSAFAAKHSYDSTTEPPPPPAASRCDESSALQWYHFLRSLEGLPNTTTILPKPVAANRAGQQMDLISQGPKGNYSGFRPEAGEMRRIGGLKTGPRSKALNTDELHHSLAQFLGGDFKQVLTKLPRSIHRELHRDLASTLRNAGMPRVGGSGGSRLDWQRYMRANPGAQRQALDALLDVSRQIDMKHGTRVTSDLWDNIVNGRFKRYQ